MGERDRRIERYVALAGAGGALLLGVLGVVGWALRLPLLTSVAPAYKSIAPSSLGTLILLGLILAGAPLARLGRRMRLALAIVAGLVSLYGLLEVPELIFGADLNGENAFTRYLARAWSRPFEPMSPAAGALMFLLGASLLSLLLAPVAGASVGRRRRDAAGALGALAAIGALIFLLGYLYGAPLLYGTSIIPIAATAALGFLLLGVGVVAAAGAGSWPLRVFVGTSVPARLMRAFVPLTVFAIVVSAAAYERAPVFMHLHHVVQVSLLAVVFTVVASLVVYRAAQATAGTIEHAQQALRESEARYHGLFDTMQEGLFLAEVVVDEAGHPVDYRYLDTNSALEPLTGLTRAEMIGRTVREVLPGIEESWIETYGRVALTGEPARLEQYASPLGRYYRTAAYSPRPGQVAVLFSDVTERVRAGQERERLLDEIEQQRVLLNAIVENTEAHLVYLDRDFNFIWVNPAYARACRKSQEEFVGHNHFEFYPHEENEAIFQQVRDTGVPYEAREKPFDFPDMPERGTTYWDWTLTPIRDESGAVQALVFSLSDVTEMVRARQRIEEAERQRAQFAEAMNAEIDHRMKNNLALIASVLQMQLASAPAGASASDQLLQAITRIRSLGAVHEQLYAGPSGGLDLVAMLRRVGTVATQVLSAGQVELSVSGDTVLVSPKQASTVAVLSNELVTNAVKYGGPDTDGQRRIRITVRRSDGNVAVSIWNSGNPVPAGFEPRQWPGLGLRLAWEAVTGQWQGEFSLHPRDGGTVAEIAVSADVLAESGAEPGATPPSTRGS